MGEKNYICLSFLWYVEGGAMRKLLIFWFTCLFICNCTEKEVPKKDPLIDAYKVDNVLLEKDQIKKDLNFFLTKYNRHWSQQDKNKCIEVLYYGQREYFIDYKILLSIISVESQYNIYAVGKNKKSTDFGLCQINSRYIKRRYKSASIALDYYHIKHSDSKYDIGLNIFSAYRYLRDISDYSDLILFSDYICAYNRGVRGAKESSNKIYYYKFMQELLSI